MLNLRLSLLILFISVLSLPSFSQFIPSDVSPKNIAAGTSSILTITGSGFGNSRGPTSYVAFPKAHSRDFSQVKAIEGDYISWTNTKIEVRVPAGAGSGSPMIAVSSVSSIYLPWLTISNLTAITSFSPTTISAGTNSLLTINGTGFGTIAGRIDTRYSGVNDNNVWSGSTKIISWTDTKIVVSVTESAGSGQIAVVLNGNWIVSSTALTVKYAVFTSPAGDPILLTNNNGSGGYTFQMENSFAANTAANASFRRALGNWVCSTNVNWGIGPNTAVNTSAKDGVNVIKFGAASDIIVGTLAYTAIGYQLCPNGEFELADIDMTFNNQNYAWNYTNAAPAANQYDFETVALHELGHAHGLVHVNNAGDVMYHTTPIGTSNRGLSSAAVEGGMFMIANSRLSTNNCYEPMVPFGAGTCPQFPTITTFSPTNAPVGTMVTITGSNFANATNVRFGNVAATSFNVVSPTQITAVIASGGASGDVSVFTPTGVASAAGFTFLTTIPQTLSFTNLPAKTFGDSDFDPSVTASSGLPVTYSSSNGSVATILNNMIHIVGAGSAIITATQTGNATYAPATINLNLLVSKADQNITFDAIPGRLISDPDFTLNAAASSGLNVSFTTSNPTVATITNNNVHIIGAGTTIITAVQNGNANFNAAPSVAVNLNVSNLPQIIMFPEIAKKKVNDPDFDPGATTNSNLPIIYSSSNSAVAIIVNDKVRVAGAGTAIITASQAGNLVYAPASAQAVLVVNKLTQTLNFPQLIAKTFSDVDFDAGASASSSLPITYSSSNVNVATIVAGKVHIIGAGTTSITATQSGNATYEGVSGSMNLTVNKLQQTISFPQIALKQHSDADFALSATSSSGLPITYSSSNTAVATIISGQVHIVASGATVITASQAGNANINTATDVTQNLDVQFNIPVSNFSIKSTDESCKTSNNGAINIVATQILTYTASVTLNGVTTTHPFNSVLALNNLQAGTYTVCITVAGQPSYKQCFDVAIKEPKDLAVYSSIRDKGNSVLLKLEGSDSYTIEINGKIITTTDQEITLPLIKGNNVVKIASDKNCQGVITKTFLTSNSISIYPNPIKNILNIAAGSNEQAKIEIHALDGRLMHTSNQLPIYGKISIDVAKLNRGLYVLTISIGNVKTVHKIIKD